MFQDLPPAPLWNGVFNATGNGPICYQKDVLYGNLMKPESMSEECLHANVYIPINAPIHIENKRQFRRHRGQHYESMRNNHKRPILVFIHGGGFAFGSGDNDLYGPEYLIKRDVIVVTFNYRFVHFKFLLLLCTILSIKFIYWYLINAILRKVKISYPVRILNLSYVKRCLSFSHGLLCLIFNSFRLVLLIHYH